MNESVDLPQSVIDELCTGRNMRLVQAERIQRLAARTSGVRKRLEHGEFKFQVHPEFYHYWGRRLGYACWKDPKFVREFMRDNPEVRVQNEAPRTTVSMAGVGGSKRFSKSYGNPWEGRAAA